MLVHAPSIIGRLEGSLVNNGDYYGRIERTVLEAVRNGTNSLTEICSRAKGAFPADVLAAVNRLGLNAELQSPPLSQSGGDAYDWPEPSPTDYEWRFTNETADSVAKTALQFGSRILCLGTPTIFQRLAAGCHDTHLVDRNPFTSKGFPSTLKPRIHVADISDNRLLLKLTNFDVIVMDPPWYPAHINHWLSNAAGMVRNGGTIILTLFRELTRPGAEGERVALLDSFVRFGRFEILEQEASYQTPLFEKETLAALGVPYLPVWRAADLVALRVNHQTSNFETAAPPVEYHWDRFLFGTQVVAIKQTANIVEPIAVGSPYENETFLFRSVSTRDPARPVIDLWTSRNRVAKLTGAGRIRVFLKMLELGETCRTAVARVASNPKEAAALRTIVALIGW